MILQHFDTFIAFAVIMVGVSLLVTILTQMIAAFFGLRGTNLKWGIKTLLENIDPNFARHAEVISEKVLHHPLISDSTFSKFNRGLVKKWKLASVIRADELINIFKILAKPPQQEKKAEEYTWEETLSTAQQVEGNIKLWFDATMDRVSQRFAVQMRIWTAIFSVLIAFALHLDALRLLTQLSADAELRASLVTSTESITKQADEILVTPRGSTASTYTEAMKDAIDRLKDQASSIRDDLSKTRFQLIPDPYHDPWWDFLLSWPPWKNLHFWGILISAALLSLGAPFWFNILKKLSNLRPILASKQQEEQQKEREQRPAA